MTSNTRATTIRDRFYEGERPLYALRDTRLEDVRFYPGESAMKHAQDVTADHCTFMGKYPFWHSANVDIIDCTFTVYARAAIWYGHGIAMRNSLVEAPKMFRRMDNLVIEDSRFTSAGETLWNCRKVRLRNVELTGADYVFMNGEDIEIDGMTLNGNYSFQDAKNVVIRNSRLNSKDAFWGATNVTVYDSVIEGEYLGWHSRNLRLVNCTVRGEQALCYATDLVMENCRMEDTELSFEYSSVEADLKGSIDSVKNPRAGHIRADRIAGIIIDEHCIDPGACVITEREAACA